MLTLYYLPCWTCVSSVDWPTRTEYNNAQREASREGGNAEVFVPRSESLLTSAADAPGFRLDALYKEYVAEKGASIPALQKMMGVQ